MYMYIYIYTVLVHMYIFVYSGPSLKGHSLERTPRYKRHIFWQYMHACIQIVQYTNSEQNDCHPDSIAAN